MEKDKKEASFKKWMWKKISEEDEASSLYLALGNRKFENGQEFPNELSKLTEELKVLEDLRKQFLEHANDEERHKEILTKILGLQKLEKTEINTNIHRTVQDTLLSIIYDEAAAAVGYMEGLREHWDFLGKDKNTRAKILEIVVDELDHLSDMVIQMQKLHKDFNPESTEKWMTNKSLAEKRELWKTNRLWEKAAASFLVIWTRSMSKVNSLTDDSKKKINIMITTPDSPFYQMRSWDIALGRMHGTPEKGRGMFIMRPYEKKTEDSGRYGDITSVYFHERDDTGKLLDEFARKISMDPDKTSIGFSLGTTDTKVEIGPFDKFPTLVKEEEAGKIVPTPNSDEFPERRYSVDTFPLHKLGIKEAMKPADNSRDIYAVGDVAGGVHFASQESLPNLLQTRINGTGYIWTAKVSDLFLISV